MKPKDKILSWFDASNVWVNQNIGRAESYGVEAAAAFHPTADWTLSANYTYNRATIEENPQNPAQEGNFLPFSPKHKANFGVTLWAAGQFHPECLCPLFERAVHQ